jgi:hypothetical protein
MYWIHPYGNKISVLFADGAITGSRKNLILKLTSLLNTAGWFAELSGKRKDMMIANGLKPITNKNVISILTGVELVKPDGSYARSTNGSNHRKWMFGKPCLNKTKARSCTTPDTQICSKA